MPRKNPTRDRALEYLEAHGETRAVDLRDALQVHSGQLSMAMRLPVREGTVIERREVGALFYSLAQPQAPAEPTPFRAARWTDGDIDLYGALELDDGGVRLTPDMQRQLRELMGPTP
jgi:hypothetical protein